LRAAYGEDSAALDLGGDLVVLSSDPITAAGARAGWLGLHVACNDVAANGAAPVAVLLTILAPESAPARAVAAVMRDAHRAARELGVEIVGGHTEVTPGLPRLLLALTAVGRVPRGRLITSAGARPGDALVLTKAAGLEGTAVLAHDLADTLRGRVPAAALRRARGFLREISVVPDALAAASAGATALHDVTEGGVLGAVHELATASDVGCVVRANTVPVRAETRAICAALGLDPLRLLGSGALLIATPDGTRLVDALAACGIPATVIGRALPRRRGRRLLTPAGPVRLRPVARDELYRAFVSAAP
jgi:hydrogenase maturation factor